MSVQAIGWVLDHSTTTGSERLVLLALANHADDRLECWPSIGTVAREANVHPDTAKRVLRRLVERGHVSRVVNGGGTHRTPADRRPNLYRIVRVEVETTGGTDDPQRGGQPDPVAGGSDRPPEPSLVTVNEPSRAPFDDFWGSYPRKIDKPGAERAYRRAVKAEHPDAIVAGLAKWGAYWKARGEPEYVPHPATWLNGRRWQDEPPRSANGRKTDTAPVSTDRTAPEGRVKL